MVYIQREKMYKIVYKKLNKGRQAQNKHGGTRVQRYGWMSVVATFVNQVALVIYCIYAEGINIIILL